MAEQAFNSSERVNEYAKGVEPEAPRVVEGNRPASSWPSQGLIEYSNVHASYRPDLPAVLRGLTFTVHPQHKVGIVGRTGAGKSSTLLTLFRIIECSQGQILIDGLDISKMGLKDLRSKIGIIPQTPLVLKGTMRSNLDPFDEYSDDQLKDAADKAHLTSLLATHTGLDFVITEGGGNLSMGERQLVCLARAVLRGTKILVLDEATASCDVETDQLIQSTIRAAFSCCTMLTIAHRLQTIIDSDEILVMDAGTVLEYDKPSVLLSSTSTAFHGMVAETGRANAQSLIDMAMGNVAAYEDVTPDAGRRFSRQGSFTRQESNVSSILESTAESRTVAPYRQLVSDVQTFLEQAECAAEDLQASPEPVPAVALEELHNLQARIANIIQNLEQKQVAQVSMSAGPFD